MKTLLITHGTDIDGINCGVLANYYLEDVDIIYSEAHDIDNILKDSINNLNNYEHVYITDLCPDDKDLLDKIENTYLSKKVKVFDHHATAINKKYNEYSFITLKHTDKDRKCSGTSIFFDYIINELNMMPKENIKKLVELTREYDTWQWFETNNFDAKKLHILYEVLGRDEYLKLIEKKLNNIYFNYDEQDKKIFNKFEKDFEKIINKILSNSISKEIKINKYLYKFGLINTEYKYRNEFSRERLKEFNNDWDFVAIAYSDKSSVSLRPINDTDLSKIAEHFEGKGHKTAASFNETNEKWQKLIKNK